MIITEQEYYSYRDDSAGYCSFCDKITNESGVEPDAVNYECEECLTFSVMGIEEAFIAGYIGLTEE